MNIYRKSLWAAALVVLSMPAHSQFPFYSKYSGIWQDANVPNKYYSLQVKGNDMIFIDLPGLEQSGNTLLSSYHGGVVLSTAIPSFAIFNAFIEHQDIPERLRISFYSDTELQVRWGCGIDFASCTGISQSLRKVF